jgi:hypothetical protein
VLVIASVIVIVSAFEHASVAVPALGEFVTAFASLFVIASVAVTATVTVHLAEAVLIETVAVFFSLFSLVFALVLAVVAYDFCSGPFCSGATLRASRLCLGCETFWIV